MVPVQSNTDAIADLTQRLALTETETDWPLMPVTNGKHGREIVALQETASVNNAAIATAVARIDALETQPQSSPQRRRTRLRHKAALRKDLDAVTRSLDRLAADLEQQQEALTSLEEDLGPRLTTLEVQADALTLSDSDVQARLVLLQSAQGLIRVQLLLLEDNPGAARSGLAIAIEHLNRYSALVPEQSDVAAGLIARIEELDALIEVRSFRTTPTLEALWADIVAMALPPLPVAVGEATGIGTSGTLTSTVGVTSTVELTLTETLTTTPTTTPPPPQTPTATPRP